MSRARFAPLDFALYAAVIVAWGMLYGAGILAIFAVLRGHPFIVEPTAPYLAGLLYLALIASVMAFACYLTLLGRIGADRAAYVTVMLPVVALAVSTVLEGYRWSIPAGLGLAAVLVGNLLVLRAPPRR
jgi:drug/metabolite transporter (DMT)-like permease